MKIRQLIKEKGTKDDRIQYILIHIAFIAINAFGIGIMCVEWDINQYPGTVICGYLGCASFGVLWAACQLSDLRKKIYKRNGIKDYRDEEIAELEKRIRRLENDKSRRYD